MPLDKICFDRVHDYDNNTKLDGLEILQAIRHTVEHSSSGEGGNEETVKRSLTSQEDFTYFVGLYEFL